jgi:hypothetical protein
LVACLRSPWCSANDGRRVLLTVQLSTSLSCSRPERINQLARRFFTRIMSHPASVPLAHLKRLIAVVRTQDGSKTQKELLPLMRASLSVGRASPPSEDIIAETIRTVQQRVKHRHEKQRKKEAEETRIAALEAQAVNTRSRQRDSAAAPNTTTSASRRPKKVSKVEVTAQTRA